VEYTRLTKLVRIVSDVRGTTNNEHAPIMEIEKFYRMSTADEVSIHEISTLNLK
jgi:hypothetical protein